MTAPYRFGRFELHPQERVLLRDGCTLPVGSRALDLLIALVDCPGELLTKERALERAWPGLVVEEANVHVQVSALRKLLGAQAIATVPGLGYRFALPVSADPTAPPNNLPAERTPFVGRQRWLEAAAQRLQATRLLTLTGIGGTGKTRAAIKLAQGQRGRFADGCWFVDLAPLDDRAQLMPTLERALGLKPGDETGAFDRLLEHLRSRQVLLLLDNCEHLLDPLASLATALLAAAPRLQLLATSREALGIEGESVLPVRPLGLPPPGAGTAEIAAADAVRLFVVRAQQVDPSFLLGADNAETVAEVCWRVDGIPLAIELAAARLRMVSTTQLKALLDERFRLLVGGRRALPRQQTLHEVIRWSYEHLAPDEQRLLRVISVCSGCDLETAAALLGDDPALATVLDTLTRLADRSLLEVDREGGPPRYTMLDTVREYAHERLQEDAEAPAVRDRHRDHFVQRAEMEERRLLAEDVPAAALARLDRDRDNLLRALAWSDRPGDATAGLRLVTALRHYWPARGLLVTGHRATQAALARAAGQAPDRWRVRALSAASQTCLWMDRLDEALEHAQAQERLARELGDDEGLTTALAQLGQLWRSLGDSERALAALDESLQFARRLGDERLLANALSGLAGVHLQAGRLQAAEAQFEAVLELRRRQGRPFPISVALLNLASIAVDRDRPDQARDFLAECCAELPRIASRYLAQNLIDIAAALAAHEGDWPRAVRLYSASTAQRSALSMPAMATGLAQQQVDLQRATGAIGAEAVARARLDGQAQDHAATLGELSAWLSPPAPPRP